MLVEAEYYTFEARNKRAYQTLNLQPATKVLMAELNLW